MIVEEDVDGEIETTTIDSITTKHSIDFIDILKIDIEGSEKELFSSNYEK
jgi:FkbM family methyltransferase